MAGNKFATMLHRNTHSVAVVLVYALLEWILIGLLLLIALFSYLISRYVSFFGLKPPCLLCTRVDHVLDHHPRPSHDMVCDEHAAQITKLGNCNHRLEREVDDGFGVGKIGIGREEVGRLDVEERATAALRTAVEDEEDEEEEEEEYDEDEKVEKKKEEEYEDDRVRRGFTTADDSEHTLKHGSCKRVCGNDAIYKILNQYQDATSTVTERAHKVESVHFRKEEDRNKDESEVDDGESGEEMLGMERGAASAAENRAYIVEIEDRAFFPGRTRESFFLTSVSMPDKDPSKQKGEKELETIIDDNTGSFTSGSVLDVGKIMVHSVSEGFQANSVVSGVGTEGGTFSSVTLEDADKTKDRLPATLSTAWNQFHTISQDTSVENMDKEFFPMLEKVHETENHSSMTTADETSGDLCEEKIATPERFQAISSDATVEVEDRELSGTLGVKHITGDSSLVTHDGELSDASREQEITLEAEERILQDRIAEMVTEVVMDGDQTESQAKLDHRRLQEPIPREHSMELYNGSGFEAQASEDDYRTDDKASHEVLSRSEICEQERINYPEDMERIARVESLNLYNGGGEEGQGFEEHYYKTDSEGICEIPIRSEICEQEHIDHIENQEVVFPSAEQFRSPENETLDDVQVNEATRTSHHLSVLPEHDELEEKILPEYAEGLVNTNKKVMLDRRESGNESMDGSAASEADSVEFLTADHLKSALKAERKALSTLYAELEEERSASAIAAHQTMAMITRLQEEKAAMQMEALQYQRMMEEHTEYEQVAFRDLDKLAKKQEKENQALMKEVDVYREKVRIYEAKERERMEKEKAKQGSDSALPSGNDDGDNSLDLNEGDVDLNGLIEDSSTSDAVLNCGRAHGSTKELGTLNEMLAEFEGERITILEQLKLLEEKLLALDDGSESTENENGDRADLPRNSASMLTSERERLAIAEEMDNLYQRLHALEEDKTFLKQCISSLKQGDKEKDLLYEIFQHLRNLRNSKQRASNASSLTE